MGSVTSTLTMRMVDGVSAPAAKARGALNAVNASASRLAAQSGRGGVAALLAGGGGMMLTAAGTYVTATAGREAWDRYASFDRRMTRIRQTADATRAESAAASRSIRALADEVGLGVGEVTSGLEDLVAAGRSLPDAMAFLPAVARTAQASGAEVADIAKTADAIGTSMKIAGDQMERAFDVLVQQGKAGKFELRDMARYLPSLAPAAAAVGLRGVEGLNKLAAVLQTIRAQTGSAEEAAASAQNIFAKMESEETAKKFAKFGVDLRKEMAKARKEGRDLLETFLDISDRALKGDMSKLPQLFSDMEFARGMRALLGNRDALRAFIAEIAKAGGAVRRDLVAPASDAASATQRLSNAWDGAMRSLAGAADAAGAVTALKAISEAADGAARDFEKLGQIMRAVRELRFGDAGQGVAEFLGGVTDETRREQARGEAMRIGAGLEAEAERTRKALAERERLDKVMSRYPKGTVPPVIQAQSEAVDRALADARARAQQVARELGPALTDAVVRSLPALPTLEGAPALPTSDATRRPLGPGELPVPTPKPPKITLPPVQDPTAELPAMIRSSGEAAVQEAELVAARIKQALDINPVIRPRVDMPSMSYSVGQRVSDSVNGGLSDNGARR